MNKNFKKILISGKVEPRKNKFQTINFQLQAMVIAVAVASLFLLGILFQVTREIADRTDQLSKSAELSNLVKEWEMEVNIGRRSRIKYVSLKEPIFYTNYQNTLNRIDNLYSTIKQQELTFRQDVTDTLESLLREHIKYKDLTAAIHQNIENPKVLDSTVEAIKNVENTVTEGLQNVLQEMMSSVRRENLQSMEKTLSSSKKFVLIAMCSFVIINIGIWLLLKRKILAPLKVLEEGAKKIGEGALGLQIKVETKNEIGNLVSVVNKMSIQLKNNQDAEVKLQKLETISQVVTSVNHEINNPLMIISGNAEYLDKMLGTDNEKVKKKLNSIISECRRIFDVTQKLKEIRNPVVEKYVGEETTMIDLKRSS